MTTAAASRLNESIDRFRADPDAAVTTPSVTATLMNGHARLSAGPFNWESDLGPAVGGENLAPSPTAYLLGALAGCGVIFLRDTLAPQFGVTLEEVSATASCTSNLAGLLGVDGANPALSGLALTIRVVSSDPAERVEAVLSAWRERCPIFLALINPNDISLDFQVDASS
mgnify:CR=1 FL=1